MEETATRLPPPSAAIRAPTARRVRNVLSRLFTASNRRTLPIPVVRNGWTALTPAAVTQ